MSNKQTKTVSEHHRNLADNLKKDLSFNGTGVAQSDKLIGNNLPDGINLGQYQLSCQYQNDLAVSFPLAACEMMVDEMVKDPSLKVLSSSLDLGYTTVDAVVRQEGKEVTPANKATGEPAIVKDVKGKVTMGISHKSEEMSTVRRTVMGYAQEAFKTK